MLHSGSRGIGNAIGQHFIEIAREDMRKHFINLPDRDLAYFVEGTDHFCGLTCSERVAAQRQWHNWFAWHPVRVGRRDCRWLETVWRRAYGGWMWDWEYKEVVEPKEGGL